MRWLISRAKEAWRLHGPEPILTIGIVGLVFAGEISRSRVIQLMCGGIILSIGCALDIVSVVLVVWRERSGIPVVSALLYTVSGYVLRRLLNTSQLVCFGLSALTFHLLCQLILPVLTLRHSTEEADHYPKRKRKSQEGDEEPQGKA
jgi:hypothetical protein